MVYVTSSATPTLEGLRITGGDASGLGGGPSGEDAGGGLYVAGSATLTGTQVFSNTAQRGGGLYQNSDSRRLEVTNGRFERNSANGSGDYDGGGGLYVRGTASLTDTQVISNTALSYGGGLYQSGSSGRVEVSGGRFERNTATNYYGGGLYVALSLIHI